MAQIKPRNYTPPAEVTLVVTRSVALDSRDPVAFANTAQGPGLHQLVFETPRPLEPGTTVAVVLVVTQPVGPVAPGALAAPLS